MTYGFDIGDPWQSEVSRLVLLRDGAKSAREKSRLNSRIRSVRLEAARAKGTHTQEQWDSLVCSLGSRCVMCGVYGSSVVLQKDHVVPVYQGGSDGIENLQPLCQPCNAAKGPDSTNWVEYRLEHGFDE